MRATRVSIPIALLLALLPSDADAAVRVLIHDGDPAPGGGVFKVGELSAGQVPELMISIVAGRVALATQITEGAPAVDHDVVVVGDVFGSLLRVATEGDVIPPGPDTIPSAGLMRGAGPVTNASGVVAFSVLTATAANNRLLVGSSAGIAAKIAQTGDPAPDGNGSYRIILWSAFADRSTPAVNAAGSVAFSAFLTGTTGGEDEAIYRWDGPGVYEEIMRVGGPVPDGGTWSGGVSVDPGAFPSLLDDGRVAFYSNIAGTADPFDRGIFIGDGGTPVTIVRRNEVLENGATFLLPRGFDVNEIGQVCLIAETSPGSTAPEAVVRADGSDTDVIVQFGTPVGGTTFRSFDFDVRIDAEGHCVFQAQLNGAGLPLGLFSADDSDVITQIALAGTPTPDGFGNYSIFRKYTVSRNGQIAFEVDTTAGQAIYRFANGVVERVVRTGEFVRGSPIIDLRMAGRDFVQVDGINDAGAVAFVYRLANNETGIALWQSNEVPIPPWVFGVGALLMLATLPGMRLLRAGG